MADETTTIVLGNAGAAGAEAPADDGGFAWDFTGWKQKDKLALFATPGGVQDDPLIYPYIARAIVRWPYPLDPKNLASYDELEMDQFMEVSKRFGAALKRRLGLG